MLTKNGELYIIKACDENGTQKTADIQTLRQPLRMNYDVKLAHQISTEPLDLKYNSISRTKMYACN